MTHRFNTSGWAFIAGLYLFTLITAAPARADQPWRSLKLEHPQRGFISVEPIKRWEDGLIVGNGTEGVLISGTPVRQSYSIGHEWLFDPRTPRKPLVRLGNYMDQYRQWSLAGEGDKAKTQVAEQGRKMGLPDILWTNPMVPAGSLQVWSTDDAKVTGSARSVDWQRGLATTAWRQGDAITHSQCFASRSDQLIAVRLTCPDDGKINAKLKLARLINPEKVAQDSKPDDAIAASPDWLSLV
jgi:alpha-L-fucosidase 2